MWSAAVLCGGRSRRMGRDKALIELDGVPMALRVARAASDAGAREVVTVGGPDVGLRHVPDGAPGEGPLGGLLTALEALPDEAVLVLSCDLVAPSPEAMTEIVWHVAPHEPPRTQFRVVGDVAVPRPADGPPQWLHAVWRRGVAERLRARFAAGERSIHRAVVAADLRVTWVEGLDPAALADADRPEDLPPSRPGPGSH